MLRKSFDYCKGTVRIDVFGSYPERLLNLCSRNGIVFWDLVPLDLGHFTVTIYAEDFIRLHRFAAKCRCKAKILQKSGIRYTARRFRKRYALLVGAAAFILVCFSFANYVWTIEVTGNETVSDQRILAALADEGVVPGVKADTIHPEMLRNRLLPVLDELSWITVTVQGTHAVVDVRERIQKPKIVPEDIPCDIVAAESGLVTMVMARAGYPLVKKGELVNAGDVLVSHCVPVRNTDRTQIVHAFGEVYARVWRTAKAVTPLSVGEKHYTGRQTEKWAVIFGSRRINISLNSSNSGMECDKIIDRYELTIGTMRFPVYLQRETYREYEISAAFLSEEEAAVCGLDAARSLLKTKAGNAQLTELSAAAEIENGVMIAAVTGESTVSIGEVRQVDLETD